MVSCPATVRPVPARPVPAAGIPVSLWLASRAGRLAGGASRGLRQGSGVSVHGGVILKLAPDALARLAAGRRTALVSGTNGKTTTTRLLAAALGAQVATNGTGANLPSGLVSALDRDPSRWAVLEVDELHLPAVARAVQPQVVVALNLTRDQLDRVHEVGRTAARWRALFAETEATVVANAADPHVTHAALAADPVWVRPGTAWTADAALCPRCSKVLDWHDLSWACRRCGLAAPEPDVTAGTDGIRVGGRHLAAPLLLPGQANRDNAAFAVAAAVALGVPAEVAVRRMSGVTEVEGRYRVVLLGGRRARLILAKNPASWREALRVATAPGLVLGLNAHAVDGRDTSWLWDVPFEELRGRTVGVFGQRKADLALRLEHAGARPVAGPSLRDLVEVLPPGPLDLVANYTAFQQVHRHAA